MQSADARHPNPALAEKLQAIYQLRGGPPIDLTIRDPYRRLLSRLNDPHLHLPSVIHVAGTNGKGSVIAMLRSIFETAGLAVHAYTSPHLIRFNERVVLRGREIDDNLLESLLDETMAANDGGELTFFEITTALAFLAFVRTSADLCLLETGLGGRLDCTNVVPQPRATVITRIGFDHMEFLGDTLEKIATEKAGIMKPGVPCVIAPQEDPAVYQVFERRAAELGCPLIPAKPDSATPPTGLAGPHQRDNTAAVLACLQTLNEFPVEANTIHKGLLNTSWPGRLQRLDRPDLPDGTELWIDGAHNESAAKALAAQAALWQKQDGRELHLALAMMRRKDPLAFITPLKPYLSAIHCLDIPDAPDAFTADELYEIVGKSGVPTFSAPDFARIAAQNPIENKRILVCGSLYLLEYFLTQ